MKNKTYLKIILKENFCNLLNAYNKEFSITQSSLMPCVSGWALPGDLICHHDVLLGWDSTFYPVPDDDQQDNRQVGCCECPTSQIGNFCPKYSYNINFCMFCQVANTNFHLFYWSCMCRFVKWEENDAWFSTLKIVVCNIFRPYESIISRTTFYLAYIFFYVSISLAYILADTFARSFWQNTSTSVRKGGQHLPI